MPPSGVNLIPEVTNNKVCDETVQKFFRGKLGISKDIWGKLGISKDICLGWESDSMGSVDPTSPSFQATSNGTLSDWLAPN